MASILPSPDEYAELAPSPGSPVWRAFNDVRLLNTAAYATLLQVAHPTVGAGVHQYSSFVKDPWGRLLRTLDYVHGTIYGGPELAGEIGARVRNMHKSIKGTKPDGSRYSAMEPDAFAWVHATLGHSVFEGYRVFATPMSPYEKEAFWREWLGVGRLIGVRYRDLPERAADFDDYFRTVVDEELEWTPAIPQVLDTLGKAPPPKMPGLRPGVWRVLRVPLAQGMRVATVGLMPEGLRRRLDLPYPPSARRQFRATAAISRASAPAIRGPLAEFGPNYVRWRHEALAARRRAARARRRRRAAAAARGLAGARQRLQLPRRISSGRTSRRLRVQPVPRRGAASIDVRPSARWSTTSSTAISTTTSAGAASTPSLTTRARPLAVNARPSAITHSAAAGSSSRRRRSVSRLPPSASSTRRSPARIAVDTGMACGPATHSTAAVPGGHVGRASMPEGCQVPWGCGASKSGAAAPGRAGAAATSSSGP